MGVGFNGEGTMRLKIIVKPLAEIVIVYKTPSHKNFMV